MPPITRTIVDIHRTPPHNTDAEQGVIGSIMLDPQVLSDCSEAGITSESFYVPAHQTIFTELRSLVDQAKPIELITFTNHLRDANLLDAIGGASFVTSLFLFVPTAANIFYYAEIVAEKYLARQIIAASTEAVRKAYEEQDDIRGLLNEVEQKIFSLRGESKTGAQTAKDLAMEVIDTIEQLYEKKDAITGLATGFSELDRMTSGLQDSEMIVIAARPSMGKTALSMNIAEHVAINLELSVAVFSLEMSGKQLMQRLVCSRARVNLQKVRDGFLAERDFPAITSAVSKIAESKLFIDESCGIDIHELRAKARRMKREHDIRLVIIDYMQLLKELGDGKNSNRQREVTMMSQGCKEMAKELKIPVVVNCQLNRKPEERGGRPRMSDLRESGSIEQDADVIILLYRPEMYEEDEEMRHEKAGEAELIIAKQRNGPVGGVPLTFLKEFTRFEDRARNYEIRV